MGSRSIREKAKTIERAQTKLESELGRFPTHDEMAEEIGVSKDEFYDILNKSKSVSVLNIDDATAFNKNDRRLYASLMEKSSNSNPFSAVNFKKSRAKIKEGIKQLPEKQRLVLSLYYYEDLNLKEIGQVLDVTESRVSQFILKP